MQSKSKEKSRLSSQPSQHDTKQIPKIQEGIIFKKPKFLMTSNKINNFISDKDTIVPKQDEEEEVVSYDIYTNVKNMKNIKHIKKSRNPPNDESKYRNITNQLKVSYNSNEIEMLYGSIENNDNGFKYTNSIYDLYQNDDDKQKQKNKIYINSNFTIESININSNRNKKDYNKDISITDIQEKQENYQYIINNPNPFSYSSTGLNLNDELSNSINEEKNIEKQRKDKSKTTSFLNKLKKKVISSSSFFPSHLSDRNYMSAYFSKILNQRIYESFEVINILGKGSFGEVYKVIHRLSNTIYAMKIIPKTPIIQNKLLRYILSEKNISIRLSHPFISKTYNSFQSKTRLYLLMQYCPFGDFGEYLLIEKRIEETIAKYFLCEIILAIEELHKNNIVYRDLKPENILFDEEGHAVLTDFGLAKENIHQLKNQETHSFCGSFAYLAPEILQKQGHGKGVDWYLLGVLYYELLVGTPPFYSTSKEILFSRIKNSTALLPSFISKKGRGFIKSLLEKDKYKRLGYVNDYEEVKGHSYFSDVNWEEVLAKKRVSPLKEYLNKLNNRTSIKNTELYKKLVRNYGYDRDIKKIIKGEELDGSINETFILGWNE